MPQINAEALITHWLLWPNRRGGYPTQTKVITRSTVSVKMVFWTIQMWKGHKINVVFLKFPFCSYSFLLPPSSSILFLLLCIHLPILFIFFWFVSCPLLIYFILLLLEKIYNNFLFSLHNSLSSSFFFFLQLLFLLLLCIHLSLILIFLN